MKFNSRTLGEGRGKRPGVDKGIDVDLHRLYTIAAQDQSLTHPFVTTLAHLEAKAPVWPQLRTSLTAITGSYATAFPALYTRLSGEERETLRLVYDSLHAPDSPRRLLYEEIDIEPVVVPDGMLPPCIRDWSSWWQASAIVKPLPEAFGAFAIAYPVIESAFIHCCFPPTDLSLAFQEDIETHRKHWEAVMQPYLSRLDLIAQGTRQALRQWHTLQDQLLSFLTNNKD